MLTLKRILETSLYVDDLASAASFYRDVLDLRSLFADDRLHAFAVSDQSVLLLFKRGASLETVICRTARYPLTMGEVRSI